MQITFQDVSAFEGWELFPAFIQGVIESNQFSSICEVGAGANPALPEQFVLGNNLRYTLLDSHSGEINKASYRPAVLICDICASNELPTEAFDVVFSRMTFEHCQDSAAAHRNIWRMLKPGGLAVHSFATLYALPFLFNRLVPEAVAGWLLDRFAPRDRERQEKFPARYHLCRGPLGSQLKRLEELGFEICEYRSYFGHSYYPHRLAFMRWLERMKTQMLMRSPIPLLTSYATVVLRKRDSE